MCFSSFAMVVFSEDLSQLFMLIPNDSTNHLKYAVLERVFSFKVPLLAFLVVGVAVVMYWGSDAGDHGNISSSERELERSSVTRRALEWGHPTSLWL